MKSTQEIKEMIRDYQDTLDQCNSLFMKEGMSEREEELSEKVDEKFTAVVDAVAEHIRDLLQKFSDIDVYITSMDTVTQYSGNPYHSYFARVKSPSDAFMAGCISKHIEIDGFPYRR